MPQDPVVDGTVADYLNEVDRHAPGLVEGLYLVGSVALDDFRPRVSDIDFVAVTADRLDHSAFAALQDAHAALRRKRPKPFFDGRYVTWDDLARPPAEAGPGAGVHEHRFHLSEGDSDPVTWQTLAGHGIACRGPECKELTIRTDPADLAAWTAGNLESYWRPLVEGAGRLRSRWGLAALTPYGVVWIVTGVARMHYTLATGEITSKAGAAAHALEAFPERWRRIAAEALRLRREESGRSLYPTRPARRRDVLDFAHMVIAQPKEPGWPGVQG